MARRHYWQFLVTDEGKSIENAEITIYIAGTDDTAYVYADEIGGEAINSAPQTVTSRKGYFEFWISDTTELNGYNYNQKFKIGWNAPGVSAGYIDYIDVFSTSVAEVDVTSNDTLKNKAVSNFLAKGWEDHKTSAMFVNGVVSIHGIYQIDEFLYDDGVPDNTNINKLVSNVMGNSWSTHTNTIYDEFFGWGFSLDGGLLSDASGAGGQGNPHGIGFVDTSSTSTDINVLVSNALAKQWHDHRTTTSDEHSIYSKVNGARNYTAGVGYSNSTIINTIGQNDFVTKSYIEGGKYTESIEVVDWIDNGDGTYSYSVVHNLGIDCPIVILWNTTFNLGVITAAEVVEPENITWISDDVTLITVTSDVDYIVRFLV